MAQARRSSEAALLEAAGRVFAQKGFHGSTIDDIAVAAGVSRPTVYTYTPSKGALLERICDTVIAEMQAEAEAVLASPAGVLERLRCLVSGHITMSVRHRLYYAIMLTDESALTPEVRARLRAWSHERTRDFLGLFQECEREGLVRPGMDLGVAANVVNSAMNSLYRWYQPEGRVGPEELADQVLLLLGGLLVLPDDVRDLRLGAPDLSTTGRATRA